MAKQKNKDWDFELRQFAWCMYARGVPLKRIQESLGKLAFDASLKSVTSEIWKINVQYYEPEDVSEVRTDHAIIEGPSLKGPITKREAKIIRIARGYKRQVTIETIARLLGRPVSEVTVFVHPGLKRASLFGSK